jgi:hypothetical protein
MLVVTVSFDASRSLSATQCQLGLSDNPSTQTQNRPHSYAYVEQKLFLAAIHLQFQADKASAACLFETILAAFVKK